MFVSDNAPFRRLKIFALLILIWIVIPLLCGRCVAAVRGEELPEAPPFPTVWRVSFTSAPEGRDAAGRRSIHITTEQYGLFEAQLYEDGSIGVRLYGSHNDANTDYFESWVEYHVNHEADEDCWPDPEPKYSGYILEGEGLNKVAVYVMLVSMADTWRLLADVDLDGPHYCTFMPMAVTK